MAKLEVLETEWVGPQCVKGFGQLFTHPLNLQVRPLSLVKMLRKNKNIILQLVWFMFWAGSKVFSTEHLVTVLPLKKKKTHEIEVIKPNRIETASNTLKPQLSRDSLFK